MTCLGVTGTSPQIFTKWHATTKTEVSLRRLAVNSLRNLDVVCCSSFGFHYGGVVRYSISRGPGSVPVLSNCRPGEAPRRVSSERKKWNLVHSRMEHGPLQHVLEGLLYLLMRNTRCLEWTLYCHSLANLLRVSGGVLFSVGMFAFRKAFLLYRHNLLYQFLLAWSILKKKYLKICTKNRQSGSNPYNKIKHIYVTYNTVLRLHPFGLIKKQEESFLPNIPCFVFSPGFGPV